MGVFLASLASPLWRLAGYATLAAGLFGAGAYWMHGRATVKFDRLNAEYNQFKGGVNALGTAAEQAAAKRKLLDIKAKEYADEDRIRKLAVAGRTIERLRRDADSARRSLLSAAPANSRCPEDQVCYDARAFERQRARHRDGVRRLLDEGTEVGIELDNAREWANRRAP